MKAVPSTQHDVTPVTAVVRFDYATEIEVSATEIETVREGSVLTASVTQRERAR